MKIFVINAEGLPPPESSPDIGDAELYAIRYSPYADLTDLPETTLPHTTVSILLDPFMQGSDQRTHGVCMHLYDFCERLRASGESVETVLGVFASTLHFYEEKALIVRQATLPELAQ